MDCRRPRQSADAGARGRREGMESLGLLPEFAGHFAPPIPPAIGRCRRRTGRSIAQNQFLCDGRTDFRHFVAVCCCCKDFRSTCSDWFFRSSGLSQINRHPELYEGRGLAIAGLVLSIVEPALGLG